MNIAAVIGIGIVGAFLALTVKSCRPEMGLAVGIAAGVVIFSYVLPYVTELMDKIRILSDKSGVDFGYFVPVIKIIGVSYITQFSAEIIKDSGEGAIAKKVEFAGKIAILIMLVPILENLITVILSTLAIL